MVTIYEVAAAAGVSPSTVSRVLNGQKVSPERTRLVLAAAARLGFTPSRAARRLRNQTSEVIALLIPDIENPFFTALARGAEDRAQQAGFSMVLCNTDDDPAKEARYLQIAAAEHMAGIVLAPAGEPGPHYDRLGEDRPVVAVDRTAGQGIDAVTVDNRAAGAATTTALLDAGYTRIACIAGPAGIETSDERELGWRQSLRRRNLSAEKWLRYADYRVEGGRAAMLDLLALPDPPDAVVTANNLMGVGALQVLSEAGLHPPAIGLAVIGELPFTTVRPATVTQVRLPARHLGGTAASMLLDRIAGDSQPARTVVLRTEPVQASAVKPM